VTVNCFFYDTKMIRLFVADNNGESSSVVLGSGFGSIVDLETGPDGLLCILNSRQRVSRRKSLKIKLCSVMASCSDV
jgi:hypothetical protein